MSRSAGLIAGGSPRFESYTEAGAPETVRDAKLPLVAIGASAGGPGALATILSGLAGRFPGRCRNRPASGSGVRTILRELAEPSDPRCRLRRSSRGPAAGQCWFIIARTSDHLALVKSAFTRLRFRNRKDSYYRPSVDVFFPQRGSSLEGQGCGRAAHRDGKGRIQWAEGPSRRRISDHRPGFRQLRGLRNAQSGSGTGRSQGNSALGKDRRRID